MLKSLTSHVLSALLFTAAAAGFAQDPAVDNITRVIPYDGVLEIGGAAVNGEVNMRFSLYDTQDETVENAPRWSEEQTVVFYAGRFSVLLGSVNDIQPTLLQADDLFLGVEVESEGAWVALQGRQQIAMTAFSLWSANAADFNVAGALNVEGTLHSTGEVTTTTDVTVGGDLHIESSQLHLGESDRRALTFGSETHRLYINRQNDYEGGTYINSDVVTDGDINVGGTLSLSSSTALNESGDALVVGDEYTLTVVSGDLRVDGDLVNLDYDGFYAADGYNGEDETVNMGTSTNRMCFLTRVSVRDVDATDEWAGCRIDREDGEWFLKTTNIGNSDQDTECAARCISW